MSGVWRPSSPLSLLRADTSATKCNTPEGEQRYHGGGTYQDGRLAVQEGILRSFRVCVILRACPGNVVM